MYALAMLQSIGAFGILGGALWKLLDDDAQLPIWFIVGGLIAVLGGSYFAR